MNILQNTFESQDKIAVRAEGQSWTYVELHRQADFLASEILNHFENLPGIVRSGTSGLEEARICFRVRPGFEFVATLLAIWKSGGVAVPLCLSHPLPELKYVVEDTKAVFLITDEANLLIMEEVSAQTGISLIALQALSPGIPKNNLVAHESPEIKFIFSPPLPRISPENRALILYTSGTTSRPKGVVSTHTNLQAQISCLIEAWEWTDQDHILNVLPLHHTHGLINVVCCALGAGATVEFLPEFDAKTVWSRFQSGEITLFMAVPTIYSKLIGFWEKTSSQMEKSPQTGQPDLATQAALSAACANLRLMVSGSAALPVPVLEKWEKISGHRLLERYGMTEIGMAISNPLKGERRAGCVGLPLPGVKIRLDEGEIRVMGPSVFLEYWQRPEATQEAFDEEGWFKTGDIAELENGYYKILGRSSVDIIKSGGYKISALEIENAILSHPSVEACAVIGLPDAEWGEVVAAAIVLKPLNTQNEFYMSNSGFSGLNSKTRLGEPEQCSGENPCMETEFEQNRFQPEMGKIIQDWLKTQIAPYKIPRKILFIADLPRNAVGKTVKTELKKLF